MTHTFKVGDEVTAVRPESERERRTVPRWSSEMDRCAGSVGEVVYVCSDGIVAATFSGMRWNFKPEWLKPLSITERRKANKL